MCAADAACAAAFPNLEAEFREILRRAGRGALRGLVPDPAGGPPVELPLSRGVVASTFFSLVQNSNSAVRLPLLAHTTYLGDTRPLVEAIVGYRRALETGISYGMHLSVMCSEDAPRMNPARAAVADRDTALGDYRVAQLAAACRESVKGDVSRDGAKPVRSTCRRYSCLASSSQTRTIMGRRSRAVSHPRHARSDPELCARLQFSLGMRRD